MLERRPQAQQVHAWARLLEGRQAPPQPRQPPQPNRTGLPAQLKAGLEALSGLTMEGVRVHRNSARPSQLGALAFAQGSDIHLGPGQERHLAHEAWHVVQQAQGRVRPMGRSAAGAMVNIEARLEREADEMGGRASGGAVDRSRLLATAGPARAVAQLRQIATVAALKSGIVQQLNAGEAAAKLPSHLLSSDASNVDKLARVYLPQPGDKALAPMVGNVEREAWYGRVDQRICRGAKETMEDVSFWVTELATSSGAESVEAASVHLLGEELHDRGLGPARVTFDLELHHNPLIAFSKTYVIKPEDRSIEKAILGSVDSIASDLNARLTKGRRVNTLEMWTDTAHGTMAEYVTTSISSIAEATLRRLNVFDSTSTVTTETIALSFLTGMYDLHRDNVMSRGGAPALIDADVSLRPTELTKGPSQQGGFPAEETKRVRRQLRGEKSGASQILGYAIEHPKDIADLITSRIGSLKARIVPVHTKFLDESLRLYVIETATANTPEPARKIIGAVAAAASDGAGASPGLKGELGDDRGGVWSDKFVRATIRSDFEEGVVPHFQYQPSTGHAFLHARVIWHGTTLVEAMEGLKSRLEAAARRYRPTK
jgi:hypothetical protein